MTWEKLVFLDQSVYEARVGEGAMTDYRSAWKGDLRIIYFKDEPKGSFYYVLGANKDAQ